MSPLNEKIVKGSEKGYSLLEALVVLGLIAAILVVTIPLILRMLYSYRAQTAVSEMKVEFRFARNACITQKVPYQVVVRNQDDLSAPNQYEVQKPVGGTFTALPGMKFTLPPGVKILNTSTAGPFLFNSRGGCTPAGNIDIKSTDGQTFQILINAVGTVR